MVRILPIGGKNPSGNAQAVATDSNGNVGTKLHARNELLTTVTGVVAPNSTRTLINRFNNLSDYSAIVVSVNVPADARIQIVLNWYIRKEGETTGTQVAREELLPTSIVRYFSTGYLEMKGNQLSIVVANSTGEEVSATSYIMGIR